jgi:uncharacterized membrane protein YphA (DoxX/SURF4 family)
MASIRHWIMRILICGIFIGSGVMKLRSDETFNKDVAMAASGLQRMTLTPLVSSTLGIDLEALLPSAVYAMILLQLSGALAILTGGFRCGAWMLLAFLALVTPVAHFPADLRTSPVAVDMPQVIQIAKNAAIAGGLLLCAMTNGGLEIALVKPGGKLHSS